jgi:hypothetical protein
MAVLKLWILILGKLKHHQAETSGHLGSYGPTNSYYFEWFQLTSLPMLDTLKKLKHLKAKVPKYPSDVYPAKM